MTQTFAYYAMVFYKRFAAYTARRLQSLGLWDAIPAVPRRS